MIRKKIVLQTVCSSTQLMWCSQWLVLIMAYRSLVLKTTQRLSRYAVIKPVSSFDQSKAVFTLCAWMLLPGHQYKIVLRSDSGTLSTQVPFNAQVQSWDLVHSARILVWVLRKKVCSHNCLARIVPAQVSYSGVKCKRNLKYLWPFLDIMRAFPPSLPPSLNCCYFTPLVPGLPDNLSCHAIFQYLFPASLK